MSTVQNRVAVFLTICSLASSMVVTQAQAAIALDRTRVIFDGSNSSMSLSISNQNKALPYLAQAWVEDQTGKKIDAPFTALPPLQRVEAGAKGQIKVQMTGDLVALPQDRESLFYFNVREIPPKSDKPNTLQIALQTRVKMFYRPKALLINSGENNVFQKKLTLTKNGQHYQVNNPTPYFVTIISASPSVDGKASDGFKPVMIPPKGNMPMDGNVSALGDHPVLTFINDFGGRPQLTFSCGGNNCTVSGLKEG